MLSAKNDAALLLEPLLIHVEEFATFYNIYSQRLSASIRDSQHEIDNLCAKMEDGYERHYLKIVSFREGKKVGNGLVCFNVDYTVPQQQRVIIRHISTVKPR
jgi:hypothetical protein